MNEAYTLTMPAYAQEHIRKVQAQIQSLQAQLQAFVDGCVCGMGVDMTAQIDVDLEAMTFAVAPQPTKREDGDALPQKAGEP